MLTQATYSLLLFTHELGSTSSIKGISLGIVSRVMTVLGLCFSVWMTGGSLKLIVSSLLGLTISNSLADGFSMYMANKASGESTIALQSALIIGLIEFLVPFVFIGPLFALRKGITIPLNIGIGLVMIALDGYGITKAGEPAHAIAEKIFLYMIILFAILGLLALNRKLVNYLSPWIAQFDK